MEQRGHHEERRIAAKTICIDFMRFLCPFDSLVDAFECISICFPIFGVTWFPELKSCSQWFVQRRPMMGAYIDTRTQQQGLTSD